MNCSVINMVGVLFALQLGWFFLFLWLIKKIEDIPYDLIAQLLGKMTVEEWIEIYEMNHE